MIFYSEQNLLRKQALHRKNLHLSDSQEINITEKRKIVQYLENPVSCGLWHLNATWLSFAGISADIWSEIEKEIKNKDTITIRSGKREKRIKVSEEWIASLREEVCSTISFIFALFDHLAKQDNLLPEDRELYSTDHEITQLILDLIDIEPIRTKYSNAFFFSRRGGICSIF